ncbi:hypothetical protein H4R18_002080 [Coemansia javaensis]|uniref:MFS general substrate transporter n=1 Tax=Coemansia javaensis TaxID=2761396 RepID=A0A9W8HJH9_9FUNG|nr:hypothetical protein H4R18_002080 [Coemansia javaensis]
MAATERTALLAAGDLRRRPANSGGASAGSVRSASSSSSSSSGSGSSSGLGRERKPLTTWQLAALTVLLAGIQFVWTVELGYGTPYLLALGLSKPLMTLVWMAGPLSGLVIHPVVGRLSDRCASPLGRRRPFIIGGAAFVVVSVAVIAYARQIAAALGRMVGVPDAGLEVFVTRTAIVLAVAGFYVLDFSINAAQACARALALDTAPLEQQDAANAYAGRMLSLGSTAGYMVGFIDLRALLPWRAESQMQALCLVAIAVFVLTTTLTCVCVREAPLVAADPGRLAASECGRAGPEPNHDADAGAAPTSEWADMARGIVRGVAHLPDPVQRVCNVQFFAWIAWFPFLFFATTWVTEIMARTADPTDPGFIERATRAGSFALFLYSLASLAFSLLLPLLVDDETDSRPLSAGPVRARVGLRTMWRASLVAMGATLLATRLVADVRGATAVIVAMAFPWAVTLWAPFALVGEYVAIATEHTAVDALPPSSAGTPEAIEAAGAGPSALLVPNRHASPDDNDDDDDDECIVGSQVTAMSPPWRRPRDLLGPQSSGHLRAVLRADSIASTIQLGDDSGAATASSTPPSAARPPLPCGAQKRAGLLGSAASSNRAASERLPRQSAERLESGAALGIHNMYVVFPQFVINAISALVFAWFGSNPDGGGESIAAGAPVRSVEYMAMDAVFSRLAGGGGGGGGVPTAASGGVGAVLRIGGVSALVAATATLFLFDRQRIRAYVSSEGRC